MTSSDPNAGIELILEDFDPVEYIKTVPPAFDENRFRENVRKILAKELELYEYLQLRPEGYDAESIIRHKRDSLEEVLSLVSDILGWATPLNKAKIAKELRIDTPNWHEFLHWVATKDLED